MVSKVLKKMETLRGFIRIPAESRFELIGDAPLPYFTMLNGSPARLDKYGRLWSPYLKNRFSIGTKVELIKTENGYRVTPSASKQERIVSEVKQQEDVMLVSPNSESKTNVYYRVLEGDCLKYLNEKSINNIHLTFLDPPYRQGKDYRFFDDNQPAWKYWSWLKEILHKVYDATANGGAIYFMQREKNAEQVLAVLRKTGWKFQNLIIWKKKTSADNLAYIDNRKDAKGKYGFDFWNGYKVDWLKKQGIKKEQLYSVSQQFPDFLFKVKKHEEELIGGSIMELKDSKSATVASFNSTVPTKYKSLEEIDVINGKNLVSRIARVKDGNLAINESYSKFDRRCFYLVRTHKENKKKVKVTIVDGSFF